MQRSSRRPRRRLHRMLVAATLASALPSVAWSQTEGAMSPGVSELSSESLRSPARDRAPAANMVMQRRVDLNSASEEQLEALGFDAAQARRIIAARPYRSVRELSRAGVPREVVKGISADVEVRPVAKPGRVQGR